MVPPEYDMTIDEFYAAQQELDKDLEKAKQDQINEIEEGSGIKVDENSLDQYVEVIDLIHVRVLMHDGSIEDKDLMVYSLDMPEGDNADDNDSDHRARKVWVWHSEIGENTCDDCAARDGEIYESEDDIPEIPVHPNCRCTKTEDVIAPDGRIISSKPYSSKVKQGKNEVEKDVKNMKMSDKGINWLKRKEGKVLDKNGNHIVYDDQTKKRVSDGTPLPPGATIGYGHLIKPGEDFRGGITEAQAIELLHSDIAAAERAVCNNITVPITQNQYDALVSFAYNIGIEAFANSTAVKYINNPDFISSKYPSLESAWRAWNKTQGTVSNGLINRRNAEWNMYNNGTY